ncbi:MAG: response regulator [Acidobacteria bacterium]|nr:response regulator [Acidobacteriota bacterium]
MSGQRLLIVDNDRAFLKEHQVALESAFEVEVVGSPDTAMQRLESGAFAFALICVEIADNRGYALCASIRRSAKLGAIKVGLISAKATEDEYKRHQGLKGRADLYLMKPVAPVALVEALRPLVPPRGVDPDNPLGDLADDGDLSSDLGGDWLGDLKTDLAQDAIGSAPQTVGGTVAISQDQIQAALASMPLPSAPAPGIRDTAPPHSIKPDMSQAEIAHLKEEIQAKDAKLRETEEALAQLQRQLNSVTVNLDELERRGKEADALQAKLKEAQAALAKAEESGDAESLRQQLKDAITERSTLIQQADQLNQQLSEKTTRTIDLLRERDKLQTQAIEIPGLQARAETAEAEAAKHKSDSAQLSKSLEEMSTKHQDLETRHTKAAAELAEHKDRASQLKEEVTGLEATVRGQGRQLAQIQDALTDAETKLKAAEEKAAKTADSLKAAEETKASLAKDVEKAMREADALRKELEEAKATHNQERKELMSGLDAKEAELSRHKDQLKAAQDANAAHEKDKQGLQGQLSDRGDRLKALAALMEELGEKLRQGGGLAKE